MVSESTKDLAVLLGAGAGIAGAGVVAYRLYTGCWLWDLICQTEKAGNVALNTAEAVLETSYKAGQATGDLWLSQTVQAGGILTPLNATLAQNRAALEGNADILVSVPQTPSGYNPSNWTWQDTSTQATLACDASGKCTGEGPLMTGLPAGMTLPEFCDGSPGSPICKGVTPAKKGLLGLGVFGL